MWYFNQCTTVWCYWLGAGTQTRTCPSLDGTYVNVLRSGAIGQVSAAELRHQGLVLVLGLQPGDDLIHEPHHSVEEKGMGCWITMMNSKRDWEP